MRLGVFGGSFDPVHHGHLIVAAEAWRRLDLTQVRLIPARQQPLKAGGHRASAADRLAMLRLAVADDERFVVDDREVNRPGPSYTVDTLRELHTEFPQAALCLLLGSDTARDLPRWHEAAALRSLATIVMLTRPGTPVPSHPLVARTLEVPAVDISATGIRERCRRRESVRYLVPAPVAEYIAERRLYVDED
ncbi:MAG: nicotinate-nucleotide adenylyltransferase [Gemmatimonadota bacterium]|nr:nicotinate-nucleotide adenylyltransferase [Gemmatimonadota bacterium]